MVGDFCSARRVVSRLLQLSALKNLAAASDVKCHPTCEMANQGFPLCRRIAKMPNGLYNQARIWILRNSGDEWHRPVSSAHLSRKLRLVLAIHLKLRPYVPSLNLTDYAFQANFL